jgi:flagellar export protein FliJ
MKNFKFRMQAALNQRKRQETTAQQTFAEADAAFRRADILLAELQEIKMALLQELRMRHNGAFDAAETRLYQEYLQTMTASIREQEAFVRDLAITREAMRLNMINASQNRQVLNTVMDRDRHLHAAAAQRASQIEIDEMASVRYTHQRSQEHG